MAELRAALTSFSDRRLNAAVATALTRTAVQVRAAVLEQMPRVFDRPTPYTLRQLKYAAATAARPVAAVGFGVAAIQDVQGNVIRYQDLGMGETPAGKYLAPSIDGGSRRHKRFEKALQAAGAMPAGWFAVPGAGARLDAFGNMSRGQIIQILSQLRITLVAGTNRNMAVAARKQIAAQRKAGGRFFVVKPGTGKLKPGVYQREFYGRTITPVVIFVRAAAYRPRFDFYGMAKRVVDENLPRQIDQAIAESAGRLMAKTQSAR